LSNNQGEQTVIGYDEGKQEYFIDRTKSGETGFEKGFAGRHTVPRFATGDRMNLTLVIDDASVELFADNGLSVMTSIFFPKKNYTDITISGGAQLSKVTYQAL
jgi:fructan beta-fructosidase